MSKEKARVNTGKYGGKGVTTPGSLSVLQLRFDGFIKKKLGGLADVISDTVTALVI